MYPARRNFREVTAEDELQESIEFFRFLTRVLTTLQDNFIRMFLEITELMHFYRGFMEGGGG